MVVVSSKELRDFRDSSPCFKRTVGHISDFSVCQFTKTHPKVAKTRQTELAELLQFHRVKCEVVMHKAWRGTAFYTNQSESLGRGVRMYVGKGRSNNGNKLREKERRKATK